MTNFFNIMDVKQKLGQYSENKKKIILILCLVTGLSMMLISGFVSSSSKKQKNKDINFNVSGYEHKLEERLLDLVEEIDGVGKAKIMVTLESSIEYIYAQERREKTDKISDFKDKTPLKLQERNDEEKKLMLVDGPSGRRQALIKTEIQPKIKGVVVVCQGGNEPLVNQQITNVLTTVLNISSSRVFVTKSFN